MLKHLSDNSATAPDADDYEAACVALSVAAERYENSGDLWLDASDASAQRSWWPEAE